VVEAFHIADHETTNGEFATFLNEVELDRDWIALNSVTCRIVRDAQTGRFVAAAPDLPVVNVSWDGARAYCRWLSRKTKRTCRLPSESEWEKAARGPESFVFSYGNTYDPMGANQESGGLALSSSSSPNGFGLRHMTGNAFEWVGDAYESDSGGERPYRVLRGGSFVLDGVYLRNSFRMRYRPTVMADDIGFRVVMELDS